MFYHDKQLQYTVRVDTPNPAFARMLQQALGGVEGEIRVMMQYLFQAWNSRGPTKYRDMLMETGTEEIAHCEMLATAIAMNLEGAPSALRDAMGSSNALLGHVMSGGEPRQFLSGGFGALAVDASGVPFSGAYVVSSGNTVADMYSNAVAEMTGRTLAARLWEATDDPGMKDMLAFLIARDTMHQQQWLAVVEELGGYSAMPIPNSFPQSQEKGEFAYSFVSTGVDGVEPPQGRWTQGQSLDGKGEFSVLRATPYGQEPKLAPPRPEAHAQTEQMQDGLGMGGLEGMIGGMAMTGTAMTGTAGMHTANMGQVVSDGVGTTGSSDATGSSMMDSSGASDAMDDTEDGTVMRSVGAMGTGTTLNSTASTSGDDASGITRADREAIEAAGAETIIVTPEGGESQPARGSGKSSKRGTRTGGR
jgi:Mn-containing catalase